MEAFRGAVYPWHCDHLGHMTVMHYVGLFDQAGWHVLSALGCGWEAMKARGETFVDARHNIEYKAEQKVGSLIVIDSAAVRVGDKSLTLKHRMRNVETGVLAATSEIVCVYFDMGQRMAKAIPDDLKERIKAKLANV